MEALPDYELLVGCKVIDLLSPPGVYTEMRQWILVPPFKIYACCLTRVGNSKYCIHRDQGLHRIRRWPDYRHMADSSIKHCNDVAFPVLTL